MVPTFSPTAAAAEPACAKLRKADKAPSCAKRAIFLPRSPFCSFAGARSHTPVMAKAGILNTPQARRRSAESRLAAAMRR